MTDLTNPIFNDEEAARKHFEALRWPDGPVCPHCGSVNNATELKGKSTRAGVWKCKGCEKPFTAMIGTVYERSHIPLHKWLLATQLMCASKKGISAHQLWRMLGFGSYRTAWFMAMRIREGMREPIPEGGLGGANWGGIAWDPNSRYAFVVSQDDGALGWVEKARDGTYDRATLDGAGPGRGGRGAVQNWNVFLFCGRGERRVRASRT